MSENLGRGYLRIELKNGYVTVYGPAPDGLVLYHHRASTHTWDNITKGLVNVMPGGKGVLGDGIEKPEEKPSTDAWFEHEMTIKTHYLQMFLKKDWIRDLDDLHLIDGGLRYKLKANIQWKNRQNVRQYATHLGHGKRIEEGSEF